MFDKHRGKHAAHRYQQELAEWRRLRDGYADLLQVASSYPGEPSSAIMLMAGESIFATLIEAALVEELSGPGYWEGLSSGVSIPVAAIDGRSLRYRAGANKGHHVQAPRTAKAIDTGTAYITNRRVIFQGARHTRQCMFGKLAGCKHDDKEGTTFFSVSNRQKPTTIHYGPELAAWFDFRLDLAMAHYRNELPVLVAQLQNEIASLDAHKPRPPGRGDNGAGICRRSR